MVRQVNEDPSETNEQRDAFKREMEAQMRSVNNAIEICITCTPMATVKPYLRQPLAEFIRERLAEIEGQILQLDDPEMEAALDLRGDAFREKLAELAALPAGEA